VSQAFAALLLMLGGAASAVAAEPCVPASVHLVRHAEKAADDGDPDVRLSEAGQARAQALVGWFEGKPVDAVYATHLRRTQHTAMPLAVARDLELRVLPAADSARLVSRLHRDHCGAHVVVVGHSNTLPEIAAGLGGEAFTIDEAEFGWIYGLTPPAPTIRRERFGEPR
jgi:phosphohistidine phosphatase SixA